MTEEEIFIEVLGTRRGFVRGMGKFVIPTPTPSSHLRYETSMNMELETCKTRFVQYDAETVRIEAKTG